MARLGREVLEGRRPRGPRGRTVVAVVTTGHGPAAGADVVEQGGGEVLAGVDADDLAAEGGGDAHGVGVLVVPQQGDDEDRHAVVEQQLQLGRLRRGRAGA